MCISMFRVRVYTVPAALRFGCPVHILTKSIGVPHISTKNVGVLGQCWEKSMSNENFNVPSKSKSKSRPSPVQYLSNVLSKYPILYIYIFGHYPRYNKFIVQVPSRPVQVPSKSRPSPSPSPIPTLPWGGLDHRWFR